MTDREWMYTGHRSQREMTDDWLSKTYEFLQTAFSKGQPRTWCPCTKCKNYSQQTKDVMGRPPPPNEDDYEPQIDPVTYEGEFFQESRGVRHRLGNRSTLTLNTEVDNDNEPDDDEEEVEVQEVTNADELSMLDRLQKGLPHVDAPEPEEDVIHDDTRDSDDDDASIDPGEETDDPDY